MSFSLVKIENFRNFSSLSWSPHPHMNIIVGNNGSGKSSLLESLCFLCKGKSFRTSHLSSVIADGKEHFVLFGKQGDNRIGIMRDSDSFDIKINGDTVTKLSYLAKLSPVQIIHPADIELVIGGPSERRAYIDWGAFYHSSEFYFQWSSFRRMLKQRNAFLKMEVNYNLLDAIDEELVAHALVLQDCRNRFVEEIRDTVKSIIFDFLPEFEFDLVLYSGWDYKKGLAQVLRSSYERDKLLGYTSYGPQRADLKITANKQPVQEILSRGQLKLLLCALRLAQSCFLEKKTTNDCLFFLDDFASELDQDKKEKLSEYLSSLRGQVFITAIDESEVNFFQKDSCNVFELKNNQIVNR